MMQFSAVPEGPDMGSPTDWHLQHLGSRAVGGAALVMVEATAVDPVGRSSIYDTGLCERRAGRQLPAYHRLHLRAGCGTGHPARARRPQGVHGTPVARSASGCAVLADGGAQCGAVRAAARPAELDIAQIGAIVESFADAARRAAQAGFRVLELHGAHGYLIHQFLSPQSNTRTDGYGGSLGRTGCGSRSRWSTAVRRQWPQELPLFFRVSATDWLAGGTPTTRGPAGRWRRRWCWPHGSKISEST